MVHIKKKSAKQQAEANRQKRLGTRRKQQEPTFSRSGLIASGLFALFCSLTVLIGFVGLPAAGPLILEDQVSRVRVISEIDFSYVSTIQTEQLRDRQRQTVPPVFLLDMDPFEKFSEHLKATFAELDTFSEVPQNTPEDWARLRPEEIEVFWDRSQMENIYNLRQQDIAAFFNAIQSSRHGEIIEEGLILLGDIQRRGVFQEGAEFARQLDDRLSFFRIQDSEGNFREVEVLPPAEALRNLRINVAALDIPREATVALFRILRNGLVPNIRFDAELTAELVEKARQSVEPVVVAVNAGETIIDPDVRVTDLQYEQLQAYRNALKDAHQRNLGFDVRLAERSILTVILIAAILSYLRISRIRFLDNIRVYLLSAAVVLLNLLFMRLMIETGDATLTQGNPLFARLLPFIMPVVIAPMIVTILSGPRQGIAAAAIVCSLNAIMQGDVLEIGVISMAASLTGIFHCRNIQLRASIVRAGMAAGAVLSTYVIIGAIDMQLPFWTIAAQIIASLLNGAFSGIIIVGVLPVLEQLFKYTSDITLLELTDFNHPLLRKMQVEAPGSYHHSLMVANLSENAASAIGANTLVCRVCSLFHDIGKIIKPEYYAENQQDGQNPHIERNPSMSALVIKSHVKEGVQLAKEFRLPRIIMDVIRQHHGTSLIQYFYYKALEQQKSEKLPTAYTPNAPRIELDQVNEATYRYEGPVPQFTESAIIMLADSVEAASRSLRKVTPQAIDELVDKIFSSRIEDRQLDDTPLTFRELSRIKESFAFTLLNMLHARVEYPDASAAKKAKKKLPETAELQQRIQSTNPPFAVRG